MKDILAAVIGILIFSALLLLVNKRGLPKNKFAVLCLLLWSLRFFCYWIRFSGWQVIFPWVILVDQNLLLLDGVFLYWFVLSINGQSVALFKRFLQILPFLFLCGLSVRTYLLFNSAHLQRTYNLKVTHLKDASSPASFIEFAIIIFFIFQNCIYLLLSIKTTRRYARNLRTRFSNLEKIEVNWLNLYLKFWLFLFLLPLLIYFGNYLLPVFPAESLTKAFIISIIALAAVFGFRTQLQQYVVITDIQGSVRMEQKNKYVNSGLNAAGEQILFEKLLIYMADKRPYLNPQLTIAALAQEIGVSTNNLSQVINSATGKNFYDFINGYRINAIKDDLKNSDDPVMIIGWKNGFNSKSAFNDVFKKNTGLTPTEYRKQKSRQSTL